MALMPKTSMEAQLYARNERVTAQVGNDDEAFKYSFEVTVRRRDSQPIRNTAAR